MENKNNSPYEIHVCFSKEDFFGIKAHERFVVAVDNKSSHVYIIENKSKNRISMSKKDYMKEYNGKVNIIQIIGSDNYDDWLNYQTVALEKTKVLLIVENEELEEEGQKVLLDVLSGDVLLSGDEYHEKISKLIEGYIEALKDCGFLINVNTVSVNRSHASFGGFDFVENPEKDDLYEDDESGQ